jgi:hypothetical protein
VTGRGEATIKTTPMTTDGTTMVFTADDRDQAKQWPDWTGHDPMLTATHANQPGEGAYHDD